MAEPSESNSLELRMALSTSVEQLDERQHEHVAFTCRYPLKRGAASNGENCLRGYLWREENVNTYLQDHRHAEL